MAASREAARQLVLDVLAAAGLDVDEVAEHRFLTVLRGQWKRTIPLLLTVGERRLTLTSLLAGVPDEGHRDVYELLLHRNERPTAVHFALDDEGDVILTGQVPLAALDAAALDEALGLVLTMADETFNSVLRAGFAGYIEAEQAWRRKHGMPPNPVSTEG